MKITILLLSVFSLMGCRNSQITRPSKNHVGKTNMIHHPEMIIKFETMAETLTRVGVESNTSTVNRNDGNTKEWYGKTLKNLGVARTVTVPHIGSEAKNRNLDVTKKHILAALVDYTLINLEKYRSSTHIPLGVFVKIEYQNGIVGWVNFFRGVPYTVNLTKNGITREYGLRRASGGNYGQRPINGW